MGAHSSYKSILAAATLLICCCLANPACAQMPFYTDDPSITPVKTIHIEVFDEYDGLQSSQFPDKRQNTANFKFNFSPFSRLELDLDFPYLNIQRAAGVGNSAGIGDTLSLIHI